MRQVIVLLVLRSGGRYDERWVAKLASTVESNLSSAVVYVSRDERFPGWWAKLSLFDPLRFSPGERLLYLDLDTLVVGDLSEIASYDGEFATISDFYRPERSQSGVMAWTPGPKSRAIWDSWLATYREAPYLIESRWRGDGEFIHAHAEPDRLDALYPGQIVSLKVHAKDGPPAGARLVCAHGDPKFDDPRSGWAHQRWERI